MGMHAKARGGEATNAQENGHGMRRNKNLKEERMVKLVNTMVCLVSNCTVCN
jgi:hypothetical protein